MSKRFWLLALAATVMAVGCGGNGGDDNGGGGAPPPPPADNVTRVNLPTTTTPVGRFTVSYLPRQGRATDVIAARIRDLLLTNGPADTFQEDFPESISFVLNGSEVQNQSALVPIARGEDLRTFDTYVLNLHNIVYIPADDDPIIFSNPEDPNEPVIREEFPAQIKIYRGREANVDLRLNDAIIEFTFDENGIPEFGPFFRRDLFEALNLRNGVIQSYLSDLMSFDIAAMPASERPILGGGLIADRIYFSGDRIAISSAVNNTFEMFSPVVNDPIPGVYANPVPIGTSIAPGEYRLLTPDPNDPSETPAQITALRGMFRPFFDPQRQSISLILPAAGSNFEVVVLPTSRGTDVFQILLIAHDGNGHVTNMYFGDADFSAHSFVAFPIINATTGSTANRIQGTIQNYVNELGLPTDVSAPNQAEDVRRGTFTITGTVPTGFSSAGSFVVFR